MFKIVIESWRKPEISRETFLDHLANVHAPLVRKHGPALGFKRYIQNHRIPSAELDAFAVGRGWGEAPDASVELWVESEEAFRSACESAAAAEAGAILEEDEKRFTNATMISAFLGQEHVIFDFLAPGQRFAAPDKSVKMVCQAWKRSDFSTASFEDRWRVGHGDLVRQMASAMGFKRYVQTHPVKSATVASFADPRGWRKAPDGLTEIWWDSETSMIETFRSEDAARASAVLEADEVQFVDTKKVTVFLAREHVVF
jgi:hypothetical protein